MISTSNSEEIERLVSIGSRFVIGVPTTITVSFKLAPPGTEIITIENGVEPKVETLPADCSMVKKMFAGRPVIVFVGSAHKPNIDALQFIIDTLAPRLPDCYFAIVGSVCAALQRSLPSNVLFFGTLHEEYKDVLLRIADIAVNPMFSGSGSNLKLAEYFAYRLPVVTTPIGARGYKIKNSREAIVCEGNEFTQKIGEVLDN
jgi:glycosyltransferase involved in cell wall biosynthesis